MSSVSVNYLHEIKEWEDDLSKGVLKGSALYLCKNLRELEKTLNNDLKGTKKLKIYIRFT